MFFKLVDRNQYIVPHFHVPLGGGLPVKYPRFIHLASVEYGARTFSLLLDTWGQIIFANEKIGHLDFVAIEDEDEQLFKDMVAFLKEKGIGEIKAGAPAPEQPFNVNASGAFQKKTYKH